MNVGFHFLQLPQPSFENNKAFIAEGLVCKSPVGLKNRQGQRIIFKVKTCDWNKYFNRYGTYNKVDQKPNTLYCN